MTTNASLIDLRRLNYFVHVVDAQGLTGAAGELFLTQQALSASVRRLEKEIGVDLFVRTGRSLQTTPAGAELYAQAKELLACGRHAVAATRQAAQTLPTPFTIGFSPTISNHQVHALVEPLLAETTTPVAMLTTPRGGARSALEGGIVDLALQHGTRSEPGLSSTIIGFHTLRVAVHADHPLAMRGPLCLRDLAAYPLVVSTEPGSPYFEYLSSLCRFVGFDPRLVVHSVHGAPEVTAVLTHSTACTLVTDPAGTTCDGRVRVIDLENPPKAPIQAAWLPHTSSAARDRLLASKSLGAADPVDGRRRTGA